MPVSLLKSEPKHGAGVGTLLLAHGAGAPMDSAFMEQLTVALVGRGVSIARFEFPYMADRRLDGRKRPPNPMPRLKEALLEAAEQIEGPLVVGGKSMGGRIASLLADELQALGLVCFGYPFHPPGKTEKLRTEHLQTIATPTLIIQGTRDPFGRPDEVTDYRLSEGVRIEWLETGDHDFKPLKASGLSQDDLIDRAADLAARFVAGLRV